MVEFKEWLEAVGYRITEGSEFAWQCFGPNAYSLDAWDGNSDGTSFSIVSDTRNQTVYMVEAHDYRKNRSYRLFNTAYRDAYRDEARQRGVDPDEAYDGVRFIDLESKEDWLEKASAIFRGDEYDERVVVPIDLPEDQLMFLFRAAHEADLSFNAYVEKILRDALADQEFVESLKEKAKK